MAPQPPLVGLSAPTQRPNEPITTPGPQAPEIQTPSQIADALERAIVGSKEVDARLLQMYLSLKGAPAPLPAGLPSRAIEAWELPRILGR